MSSPRFLCFLILGEGRENDLDHPNDPIGASSISHNLVDEISQKRNCGRFVSSELDATINVEIVKRPMSPGISGALGQSLDAFERSHVSPMGIPGRNDLIEVGSRTQRDSFR